MNPPDANDSVVTDFAAFRRAAAGGAQPPDGGGPTGSDIERRVRALEDSLRIMDGKLDKILDRLAVSDAKLASVDAKLDAKASAVDVAAIRGRVDALPTTWQTTWQMITLVIGIVGTILGGAFLILEYGLHAP